MSNAGQFECVDPEIGEMLPSHARGTLGASDRPVFSAHLKACARCAEEELLMREVARGIASLRLHPDPGAAVEAGPDVRRVPVKVVLAAALGVAAALALWLATGPGSAPPVIAAAEVRALEARVHHLEAQNAMLAHAVAQDRSRSETWPLAGIPIASPPNL